MAQDNGKKKSEMAEDELNRYWDSYFATVDAQNEAREKLQQIENSASDLGERSEHRADRLRVDANIELLKAKRMAFNAETSRVQPPSQATVDELVALVAKVAAETAKRNRAKAIVGAATGAMTTFSAIQTKP